MPLRPTRARCAGSPRPRQSRRPPSGCGTRRRCRARSATSPRPTGRRAARAGLARLPAVASAGRLQHGDRARALEAAVVAGAARRAARAGTRPGRPAAAAASSSMNDSEAKVTCGPSGSRRLPVRSGVSHTSGRLTTWVVVRRCGMAYMSDGSRGAAAAGCRLPPSHQLRDQHRVGLVVADVVVVGGARVVVERRSALPCGIERAAQLDGVGRALGVPGRLLVRASTARAPAGPVPAPGTPPRSRRRRRPCGRRPAAPPSRRRAPGRAAARGTGRRRSAGRTTSCRSSRSSAGRSDGSAMACAGPNGGVALERHVVLGLDHVRGAGERRRRVAGRRPAGCSTWAWPRA